MANKEWLTATTKNGALESGLTCSPLSTPRFRSFELAGWPPAIPLQQEQDGEMLARPDLGAKPDWFGGRQFLTAESRGI
jgi:hypothetical protein